MAAATDTAMIGPNALDTPSAIATPARSRPAPNAGAIHGRSGRLAKVCNDIPQRYSASFSWGADVVG